MDELSEIVEERARKIKEDVQHLEQSKILNLIITLLLENVGG